MVTALALALIASLAPLGRARETQGNAAPHSSQDPSRAAHELEQRVLELRARIDAAGEPDARLLREACEAATDLLATPAAELSTLAPLEQRIALARRLAAALRDPDESLRVECASADALTSSDPRAAYTGLLAACEQDSSAATLLPYAKESLLALAAQLGEWDTVERLLPECRRAVETDLARTREELRAAGTGAEAAAPLGAFLDVVQREVAALACEVESRSRLGLLDLAASACADLERVRRELVELIPQYPTARLASDPFFAQLVLGSCESQLFAYLSGRDFIALLTVLDEVEALHLAGEPEVLRALAYNRAHALSELARDGAGTAQAAGQAYREILLDAKRASGKETPQTDVELDAALGLCELLLREHELAEAGRWLEACTSAARALADSLQGLRGELARARIAALRSALLRARDVGREELRPVLDELLACRTALLERQARLPLRAGGVGALHWGQQRDLLSECVDTLLAVDPTESGRERALDLVLEAQLLGTFARRLELQKPALADVRARLLGENEGLVVILPALRCTHLFLVDRARVRHASLADRGKLLALVRPFAQTVSRAPASPDEDAQARRAALETSGRALARELLGPEFAEALQGWTGFYVCGLEYLESPPIEALPARDGRPLGCTHSIAWLPSVAEALWLLEPLATRSSADTDLLLMSSAVHGESVRRQNPVLAPIQLSDTETKALCAGFATTRVVHLEREQASRAELARRAPKCRLSLEIFGHGVPSSVPERPAAVALSASGDDDGRLDCDWIEKQLDPPPLVSLFACGTAFGHTRLGDDTAAQLGNSLLFKRARAVLLSRARLSLGAMLVLDEEFHRGLLAEGRTPADALRAGRARLCASREWNDPFYFGTVSLLGIGLAPLAELHAAASATDSAPRVEPSTSSSLWIWVVLALVAGTIAPVVWRRRARKSSR